jgi:small-conductance mechanosensitive channel
MQIDWDSWITTGIALGVALGVALLIVVVTALVARATARRRDWAKALVSKARHPYRLFVTAVLVWIALHSTMPNAYVDHGFLIGVIAVGAWLVGALVSFALGLAMSRYRTDVPDNRVARKVQTQLTLVRRLVYVVIVIVALGAILLTFPGVEAIGTSVLASAGLVSIVAGLAAQSTLANVFAGVQLAFSDAVRLDDVVIVEGEWGRVEEITLTYVVVHIWDDRRLVLPSTYFTSTPFQNWTRRSSELLGSVEFDLDWGVSPVEMRAELDRVLAHTALWDGRASVLQVTDAVGGYVRIRILVTAVDAPTLFDLRCLIREELVEWLHASRPESLPASRIRIVEDRPKRANPSSAATDHQGLFTGTADAEERASLFTASMPIVDANDTKSAG